MKRLKNPAGVAVFIASAIVLYEILGEDGGEAFGRVGKFADALVKGDSLQKPDGNPISLDPSDPFVAWADDIMDRAAGKYDAANPDGASMEDAPETQETVQ